MFPDNFCERKLSFSVIARTVLSLFITTFYLGSPVRVGLSLVFIGQYCFPTVQDFSDYWKLFYFPDASQISAMVGDHSRQMETQICTGRGRRRWISLITNPLNCWTQVSLSQINVAPLENTSENLGQTSSDCSIYRQNLWWSAKSKIANRLLFSRHMTGFDTKKKEYLDRQQSKTSPYWNSVQFF